MSPMRTSVNFHVETDTKVNASGSSTSGCVWVNFGPGGAVFVPDVNTAIRIAEAFLAAARLFDSED